MQTRLWDGTPAIHPLLIQLLPQLLLVSHSMSAQYHAEPGAQLGNPRVVSCQCHVQFAHSLLHKDIIVIGCTHTLASIADH